MTREEAIAIIENEKECVNRANKNDYCNRDCYNCELVKTDTEILTALDMAIKALEQEPCDDTISRKAVLETIDDCNSDGLKGIFCSYGDGERFKEYIKELPSVISKGVTVTDFADKCRECGKQKNGKWIPVSEELPEDYQRVLITVVNYDGDKVVRVAVYYDLKKIFKVKENNESWKVGEEGLLAWQPLPEPYQEEKE